MSRMKVNVINLAGTIKGHYKVAVHSALYTTSSQSIFLGFHVNVYNTVCDSFHHW